MNKPILLAAVALVALIGSAFAVPAFQIANAQFTGGGGPSEQQLKLAKEKISNSHQQQRANPAGANMTSASNMTTTGNTTVGPHGSSIPTTNPAGIANRP
jgi:hypothetical protein